MLDHGGGWDGEETNINSDCSKTSKHPLTGSDEYRYYHTTNAECVCITHVNVCHILLIQQDVSGSRGEAMVMVVSPACDIRHGQIDF